MVLDLLTFFGIFIVAAPLSHALGAGRTPSSRAVLGIVLLGVGFEMLAFRLPFHAVWIEMFLVLCAVVTVALVLWAIGIGAGDDARPRASIFALPLLPFLAFTPVGRVHHAQKMAEHYDGTVASKYRLGNHNARVIDVVVGNGAVVTIEGVDSETWSSAVPGKSRLAKPAWSSACVIDGAYVRAVPRGYVMFLGPFED